MFRFKKIKKLSFCRRWICRHELFEAVYFKDLIKYRKSRIRPEITVFSVCSRCGRIKKLYKTDNTNFVVFNFRDGFVYCADWRSV